MAAISHNSNPDSSCDHRYKRELGLRRTFPLEYPEQVWCRLYLIIHKDGIADENQGDSPTAVLAKLFELDTVGWNWLSLCSVIELRRQAWIRFGQRQFNAVNRDSN
jgi:hypothetical protein